MCYGSNCVWENGKGDCVKPQNRTCPYDWEEEQGEREEDNEHD